MFEGILTALVTPFRNGEIDEEALRELVDFQLKSGVQGLVPCGSTGESATCSHEEHRRVVELELVHRQETGDELHQPCASSSDQRGNRAQQECLSVGSFDLEPQAVELGAAVLDPIGLAP